ncbi:hypothetical protein B0H66DRAFT_538522 [Apodospora peruviana]|uniref:Uncharacterized protein n=1 Tax=Apodospora peruviana TaxID=516989 RepID=A0AAE0LY65_9PEZI|nr:hypothetical protein B0H66DRAFT_538522 [Apodospora peruviana]
MSRSTHPLQTHESNVSSSPSAGPSTAAAARPAPAATSTRRPRGRPPGSTGHPRRRPPESGGAPTIRKPVPGARKEEFTGFDEETLATVKAMTAPAETWAVNANRNTANNIRNPAYGPDLAHGHQHKQSDAQRHDASVMCIKKQCRVHGTILCTWSSSNSLTNRSQRIDKDPRG